MTSRFGHSVWLVPAAVALGLVVVVVGAGNLIVDGPAAVRDWDASAVRWLADRREPWLVQATGAGTYLADTWTIIGATALLAAATGWWSRRWRLPVGIVLLTAGETAIYQVSNTLVDRPRPAVSRLDPGDALASFPSGHVAAAVCFYGGAALVLRGAVRERSGGGGRSTAWWRGAAIVVSVVSVAAVVAPLVVAFCRTYRGMHYPTDVAAGAFLGVCWLITVYQVVLVREAGSPAQQASGEPRSVGTSRTSVDRV